MILPQLRPSVGAVLPLLVKSKCSHVLGSGNECAGRRVHTETDDVSRIHAGLRHDRANGSPHRLQVVSRILNGPRLRQPFAVAGHGAVDHTMWVAEDRTGDHLADDQVEQDCSAALGSVIEPYCKPMNHVPASLLELQNLVIR